MDRKDFEKWLKPQILNVCLASLSRKDGDLNQALTDLYDRIGQLVKQAQREALAQHR